MSPQSMLSTFAHAYLLPALFVLALPTVQASDGHDAPAAKPAAKAVASVSAAPAASAVDPMDSLREKLAAKLGASQAPTGASPYIVRVVSKTGGKSGNWTAS